MKGLYATKKLQEHKLYKEYQENLQFYYQYSLQKENNQKSYLNRISLLNKNSGEILKMNYDFERKYKVYTKTLEQKIYTIEHIAKGLGYASAFITFTLPSHYHPFKSKNNKGKRLYVSINKDFAFDTIKEAINDGYKQLNTIYRSYYKAIKKYISKNANEPLYTVKVFEPHSSSILHLHCLLFFPIDYMDVIKSYFKNTVSFYNLSQADFEEVKYRDNVKYPTRYLLKYVTKELKDGFDYFSIRATDGYRRSHKIRYITTSQISLNLYLYNKIFFSLHDNIKAEIDKKVATLGIPIYFYIMENTYITKRVKCFEVASSKIDITRQGDKNSLFKVIIHIERKRKKSNLSYKVKKLFILYDNELIYKHNDFIKLENISMED